MARYYEYNKLPDAKERAALGQAVGLSARAVQVWFQNKRACERKALGQQKSEHLRRRPAKDRASLPRTQAQPGEDAC